MKPPLSEKFRPTSLEDVVGQNHILSSDGLIRRSIDKGQPLSILLWGPPGCGKTTLAKLYASSFNARFIPLSAVFTGVADLRKIIAEIESTPLFGQTTVVFVDEIHRFNKAQQDAFLPYVEKGTFILIGATTENPSFSLNNALLSRMRVLTLNPLDDQAMEQIIVRYEQQYAPLPIDSEARARLLLLSGGDGRYLLNLIENLENVKTDHSLSLAEVENLLQRRSALFDKSGDGHYNLISALHKAVRGSDPQAALYWFCRMLEGGEDPLFISRRMIRMASEDIGLADPQAMQITIAARESYQTLGSPEGELSLAEAVVYLALAPKSNSIYTAYKAARKSAAETAWMDPPKVILNAPTKLMKELDYGKDYIYDHDTTHGFSGQNYFPDDLERQEYYVPVERGFEREMKKRIDYFIHLRKNFIAETQSSQSSQSV